MLNNENKKTSRILVLIIIGIVVIGIIAIIMFMNKGKLFVGNLPETEDKQNDSKIEETKNTEKVENKLIPGAEYYASERDINGVTRNKFSFFIGNDRKILTYSNESKESKIEVISHNLCEDSVSTVFNVDKIEVVVSDDKYHKNSELIDHKYKTLVDEENGIKYYMDLYKDEYNLHYFETMIDGIPVSFYVSDKSYDNKEIFAGIQELASKLSVNDKVGLWVDWIFNKYYMNDGIALKSAKLFSILPVSSSNSSDKILIDGNEVSVDFSDYYKKGKEISTSMVAMGELAGQKYGYRASKDMYGNTDIYVYIYKSILEGNTETFANEPSIFCMYDLNKTDLTAEEFTNMVIKQVIEVPMQ